MKQILKHVVFREKASFVSLLVVFFTLGFIFVVAVSMLFGLQEGQIALLRDVIGFDFIIDGSDVDGEVIEKLKSNARVYEFCDVDVYSVESSTHLIIRYAEEAYYTDDRFKSNFISFRIDEDSATAAIIGSYNSYEKYISLFKGANKRAVIRQEKIRVNNYFVCEHELLSDYVFAILNKNETKNTVNYGIYAKNIRDVKKLLSDNNIEYKTYKEKSATIWSALMIERALFIFVLVFLIIIIALLLLRLFDKFIDENKRNITIIRCLGGTDRMLYALFASPAGIFAFLFSLSGSALAGLFIKMESFQNLIFSLIFTSQISKGEIFFKDSNILFIMYNIFFLFVMLIVFLCLVLKIRKVDVISFLKLTQ